MKYRHIFKAQILKGIPEKAIGILPGQYLDTTSGLHYNYHRYYNPFIGRYVTSDPIGLVGGINLYAYTLNNPINGIDPYGLYGWYSEFNPLNPNSAMSRQSIGMWQGIKGTYYSVVGDTESANIAYSIAGQNSGHQILDDNCAPKSAYVAYYGAIGTTAVAELAAGGLIAANMSAGLTTKIAFHGAHHTFRLGNISARLHHIQIMSWRVGVKGSHKILRILLPW